MNNLPQDRLADLPLADIGDQILGVVGMLTGGDVPRPIVFIAVGDADTGEVVSTGNMENPDIVHMLLQLIEAHGGSADGPEKETGQ